MKSIALVNFKGGAGKTTAALLLAKYASVKMNKKVLLVDFDSQMTLTLALEMEGEKGHLRKEYENWIEAHRNNHKSIVKMIDSYEKSKGELQSFSPNNYIFKISENLHLIPADVDLYWLEFDLLDREKVKSFINKFLTKLNQSNHQYDFILFDCPANFNDLSFSVLSTVDMVLVPVNPDDMAKKALVCFIEGLVKRLPVLAKAKISIFMNKAKVLREMYLTQESKNYLHKIKDLSNYLITEGTKVNVLDCFLPEGIDLQKVMENSAFQQESEDNCKCLFTNILQILENE